MLVNVIIYLLIKNNAKQKFGLKTIDFNECWLILNDDWIQSKSIVFIHKINIIR